MHAIRLWIVSAAGLWSTAVFGQEVPLCGKAVLRFASPEEGRAALGKSDLFVRSLSKFDRQARMATEREVSGDEFLRFAAAAVEAWPKEDIAKVSEAAASVHKRLASYRLPFPQTVLLVRTSGDEEGGAAYCRENAVVLPSPVLAKNSIDNIERILLHELFHVLSSHNPKLRAKLYAIIGFAPAPGIELPKSLRDRKITNPDAPTIDYRIEVTIEGQPRNAAPVLYASLDKFTTDVKGTFFKHMLFKLMLVEEVDKRWQPVEINGKAVVFDPRQVPSFMEQIGSNTNYIIHPDEILADNFVHLALDRKGLATPRIVDQMREVLGQ